MEVKIINYTPHAAETLIFSKQTRLNMTPGRWEEVCRMGSADIQQELKYMADSIPSSWEFVDYIFLLSGVSRAFTHQFVRTRTNSYAQQSMRVTEMGGFDYYTGPSVDNEQKQSMYDGIMSDISTRYNELIDLGVKIEDARGMLPTNISTNILAKINLRTMSDLSRSRVGGRTQDEYISVVNLMMDCVLDTHSWADLFLFPKGREFFDDVEAFARDLTPDVDRNTLLKIIDKMRKQL